jgi:glycerol-3-phosphate dehydrogenase
VQNRSFIVPLYDWWEGPFYGVGLKLYDALAGKLGLGPSQLLSRTAVDHGATVINHLAVTSLIKESGQVFGVIAKDAESGREFELAAKVVINATGPFCDTIRRLDDPAATTLLAPSQGIHLVLPRAFLPGESAIMVPHTDDGRVLFAVPWHERVLLGTTDTPVDCVSLEARPLPAEIDFLLQHAARYLHSPPQRQDILSIFAGLRPLVKSGDSQETASLSRDHTLLVTPSGLVTITGGKWTTYRKMGEETINLAARIAVLPERPSRSAELPLHGAGTEATGEWAAYGSDAAGLEALCLLDPTLRKLLHPDLPYRRAEIVWAIRHEWAASVEDLLARRTRALILDARAAIAVAPAVAAPIRAPAVQAITRVAGAGVAQPSRHLDVAQPDVDRNIRVGGATVAQLTSCVVPPAVDLVRDRVRAAVLIAGCDRIEGNARDHVGDDGHVRWRREAVAQLAIGVLAPTSHLTTRASRAGVESTR